jgi:hypothetical protein
MRSGATGQPPDVDLPWERTDRAAGLRDAAGLTPAPHPPPPSPFTIPPSLSAAI